MLTELLPVEITDEAFQVALIAVVEENIERVFGLTYMHKFDNVVVVESLEHIHLSLEVVQVHLQLRLVLG